MNFKLSPKQKEICHKTGKFVVTSCAGSGKTSTLSSKLIYLIKNNTFNHSGVATLSFTNVAKNEIWENLNSKGINLTYPHYLGTIDSFFNNFIFYPYYYLLKIFKKRPVIVGKPSISWIKSKDFEGDIKPCFDLFSFDINNDLIKIKSVKSCKIKFKKYNKDNRVDKNYKRIIKMKYNYFKKGFVTQSDINYFSLILLKKYPFISKVISNKFHTFLIDESQDTNEIQKTILDIISCQDNIREFVYIGDFNQAIFEWNNAKPELFYNLSKEYDCIKLNENWRSSKNLCDFSSKLLDNGEKSIAVNDNVKNFPFKPIIKGYNEINGLIDYFLEICDENDIIKSNENIVILSRSHDLLYKLMDLTVNNQDIWKDDNITKEIVYSKLLFDENKFFEAYEKMEYILPSLGLKNFHISNLDKKEYINNIGFYKFNENIFQLFKLMPKTNDIGLQEWLNRFKINLKNSNFYLKKQLLDALEINEEVNIELSALTPKNYLYNKEYSLSTIHKVKGETYDAVMLILKTKDKQSYKKSIIDFKNKKIKNEDLRNVYVGITRASKVLILAVPNKDKHFWYDLFYQSNLESYF